MIGYGAVVAALLAGHTAGPGPLGWPPPLAYESRLPEHLRGPALRAAHLAHVEWVRSLPADGPSAQIVGDVDGITPFPEAEPEWEDRVPPWAWVAV